MVLLPRRCAASQRLSADDCRGRVRVWVGIGKWGRYSYTERLYRQRRQCGDPGPIVWGLAILGDTINPNPRADVLEHAKRTRKRWQ